MLKNFFRLNPKRVFIISFICILFVVLLDNNTYFSTYFITSKAKIILLLIISFILLLIYNAFTIHKRKLFVFLFMSFGVMLSVLINQDSSMYFLSLLIVLGFSFLISNCLNWNQFSSLYKKIILFFCIYSFFSTYLTYLFPSLFIKIFPTFLHYGDYDNGSITFLNCFFTNVHLLNNGSVDIRNYGPFTEPGEFQLFIILAFIIETFNKEKKQNILYICIYYLTCLSTFSTAGLIIINLLMIIFLFTKKQNKLNFLYLIFLLILIIIFNENMYIKENFISSFNKIINKTGSYYARYGSFIANFKSWIEKPIFGWGYSGFYLNGNYFSNYTSDNTNTIFSYLAIFGLLPGFLVLVCIFNIKNKLISNKIIRIASIFAILLSTSNENFMDSILFLLFIFSLLNDNEGNSYEH